MAVILNCPFCGSQLDAIGEHNFGCPKCRIIGFEKLWRNIIFLQSKLDMAIVHISALLEVMKNDNALHAGTWEQDLLSILETTLTELYKGAINENGQNQ